MDATAPLPPFVQPRVGPEGRGHPPPHLPPEAHGSPDIVLSSWTPSSGAIASTGPGHPSWFASIQRRAVDVRQQ